MKKMLIVTLAAALSSACANGFAGRMPTEPEIVPFDAYAPASASLGWSQLDSAPQSSVQLTVRALDGMGRPCAGARVAFWADGADGPSAITGADGRASAIFGLTPGAHQAAAAVGRLPTVFVLVAVNR